MSRWMMIFYYRRTKKTRVEDKKCHSTTMMSIIADRTLKKTSNMCHLVRTWRKENKGRS